MSTKHCKLCTLLTACQAIDSEEVAAAKQKEPAPDFIAAQSPLKLTGRGELDQLREEVRRLRCKVRDYQMENWRAFCLASGQSLARNIMDIEVAIVGPGNLEVVSVGTQTSKGDLGKEGEDDYL